MSRGGGFRVPSAWRRRAFWTVLAGLVAGNAWLLRKQFPADEQRKNEAYDRGLLAMDPSNPKRDCAAAEVEFRRYLAISDDPRVRVLLAIALSAQGKLADARTEFAAAVERNPALDEARIGLAELAAGQQDYGEALRQLAAAESEEPTPADAWALHGRILTQLGDLDGAVATYRRALERDSGDWQSQLAVADLLAVRSFLTGSATDREGAAGSYREAEVLVKSRLSRADDRRLRLALARAIAGQVRLLGERDLAEAVRQIRDVAERDPADPEPTLLLARFLVETGNDVEARRTFEDAASRWPRPDTAIAFHEYLASRGETAAAAKVLEDAIQRTREDLTLRFRLLAYHVTAGKMEDGERELANAETVLAGDVRLHEIRGDLEREKARRALVEGRADDAGKAREASLAAYRRALAATPHSPRLKKKAAGQVISALLAAGRRAEPTEDERFARACIDEVLRVNPSDAEAIEWQARLLLAEGRSREATEILRPLAGSARPSLDALRLLGAAASAVGDDAAACEAFVRVVEILAGPEGSERRDAKRASPDDWANAARAAARAGRADLAARHARAGAAAWPESSRVAAALGLSMLAQGDATGAVESLSAARRSFPADAEVRVLLARAFETAGRAEDAAREYESAAADLGTNEAKIAYLDFLARTGRADRAEQGFLELIAGDPTNPAARVRLGDFYLSRTPPQREAALREYEAARQLDPAAGAPLLRIADVRIADAKGDPKSYAAAEEAAAQYEALAAGDAHVDYLRGKLALVAGRTDEAVERLRKFTERSPDTAAGHYYLCVALRAAGRPEEAAEPIRRAVRLAPGDAAMRAEHAALQFDLGVRAFEKGDFRAARDLFRTSRVGGVAGPDTDLLVAGSSLNAGELDVGEAECRSILEANPANVTVRKLLAAALLRRGTKEAVDEAETIFRAVLADDADDLYARLGFAAARFAKGLYREALGDLRLAYVASKSNPMVALPLCMCMSQLGDTRGAVEFLDAESAAHPAMWDFLHMKGDFLMQLREPDQAAAAYVEASSRAPELAGPPMMAAAALLAAGKLEDARSVLVARLGSVKEPVGLLVALGEVLMRMGRTDEARENLRRAVAIAPGQPRALFLLGRIAEAAGRRDEARGFYREAADRGGRDPEVHARLGAIATAERDLAAAREHWLAALRLAPRNPLILNNVALALASDPGRVDDAIDYARQAAAIAPERPEIADTYGWLLFTARRDRDPEAAEHLTRAASLLEGSAVVQFHAGMVLARMGRAPEARMHLERALRIDARFDGADTARSEIERLR